jgi:hypothetical protein
MTTNGERKIGSLRDLPLDIAPPHDLWKGIETQIAADRAMGADPRDLEGGAVRRFKRPVYLRALAAAAVIAALAVGIWIGRAVLPVPGGSATGPAPTASINRPANEASALPAGLVLDPKYNRDRAALVKGLEARLAALPPDSRAKVITSLKAINDSKRELEAELGKDPSNALLQELLVTTYQDEMRVLTAVHEAGRTGEGI